ncbi:hypothetical protein AX14_002323 [Amanita brunnescens Koide BX004]|nr:hypothetical protein AX14_002323 [Amanita brunnescens Koide BX004]
MSIFTAIENRERGVFVLNGGPPESKVIVISNPTQVELIPGPHPVHDVARIKGANGLYINIGPVGVDHLVWSEEPREWTHNIDNDTISTTYHGQTLYWFLRDEENTIILNPYEGTPFLYVRLA